MSDIAYVMQKAVYILVFISHLALSQSDFKHSVYFDTDKFKITSSEESKFNSFLAELDNIYIGHITIYGFCDDRGTEAYNLDLSRNRANSVKTLFIDNEVSSDLITVLDGKGELQLNSNSNIKETRRNNRRVDIIIIPKGEKEENSIEIPTAQTILKGDVEVGDKIRLKNLYFKTGYSSIVPESIDTLKEIADILVEREEIHFTIQGHVCCTHDTYDAVDRKTNKRNLSVARAKFIYNYLLRKGVEKRRMNYIGLKRKFTLDGDPKYDRRVEIEITYMANKD